MIRPSRSFWMTLAALSFILIPADTVKGATEKTFGPVNSGFEQELKEWSPEPAKDHASIQVVQDATAPDGSKVLRIDHQRTRSSQITQQFSLKPFTYYLFSCWVRSANYMRTGSGFTPQTVVDGKKWGDRLWESQLSEQWMQVFFPVVTGATGSAQLLLRLDNTVGTIWIDNVKYRQSTFEEARRLSPSDGTIPSDRISTPGHVVVEVHYNEIPVSQQAPSLIHLRVRPYLAENIWEQTGKVNLELPREVTLTRPQNTTKEQLPDGFVRYTLSASAFIPAYYGSETRCYLTTTLPAGERKKARIWPQWGDQREEPIEVEVTSIALPAAAQPRQIVTATTVYNYLMEEYPDYPKLLRSLGFNTADYWNNGTGASYIPKFRENGIEVNTLSYGLDQPGLTPIDSTLERMQIDPAEQAVGRDGKPRSDLPNLSVKGKLYQAFLAHAEEMAQWGFSALMWDEELFRDWNAMDVDCSDADKQQWRQWLSKVRPDLPVEMPEIFLDDPLNHLDQYNAWWSFRASLTTDWFSEASERFKTKAREVGANSSNKPWVASYVGYATWDRIKAVRFDAAQLAHSIDRIFPMYYYDGYETAKRVRNLVRAVGKEKAYIAIDFGDYTDNRYFWRPGELRTVMLESLFAGARGYVLWSWPLANLRQIAEAAQTNDAVAAHEDIFINGQSTNRFWTLNEHAIASTLETSSEGLLLVSNYTKVGGASVTVQKRPETAIDLTEVFTGQKIHLTQRQQLFELSLTPGTCALWKWQEAPEEK